MDDDDDIGSVDGANVLLYVDNCGDVDDVYANGIE